MPDKKLQLDKFKKTARAIGCDESEAAFDEKLGKLSQHKPAPESKPEKE